jgi:hypothetical protein
MSQNSQERKGNTMDYDEAGRCLNDVTVNPNYKTAESSGKKASGGGGSFPTSIGKKNTSK